MDNVEVCKTNTLREEPTWTRLVGSPCISARKTVPGVAGQSPREQLALLGVEIGESTYQGRSEVYLPGFGNTFWVMGIQARVLEVCYGFLGFHLGCSPKP